MEIKNFTNAGRPSFKIFEEILFSSGKERRLAQGSCVVGTVLLCPHMKTL